MKTESAGASMAQLSEQQVELVTHVANGGDLVVMFVNPNDPPDQQERFAKTNAAMDTLVSLGFVEDTTAKYVSDASKVKFRKFEATETGRLLFDERFPTSVN